MQKIVHLNFLNAFRKETVVGRDPKRRNKMSIPKEEFDYLNLDLTFTKVVISLALSRCVTLTSDSIDILWYIYYTLTSHTVIPHGASIPTRYYNNYF